MVCKYSMANGKGIYENIFCDYLNTYMTTLLFCIYDNKHFNLQFTKILTRSDFGGSLIHGEKIKMG